MKFIKSLVRIYCVTSLLVITNLGAVASLAKPIADTNNRPTPATQPVASNVGNAEGAEKKFEFVNGSDWEVMVKYTGPKGSTIVDAIPDKKSKMIATSSFNVTYQLQQEAGRFKTKEQTVPVDAITKGVFQVTQDMAGQASKELV